MCVPPQKVYQDKLGADKVELLKESGDVDPSALDPRKVGPHPRRARKLTMASGR